jgi:hypothetical protein
VHAEEAPLGPWLEAAERLRDPALLAPTFDEATIDHFLADPGGRRLVWAREPGGRVLATAMQARTFTKTASGVDPIPALHYIRLAEPRADALGALVALAQDAEQPVVLVPNAITIPPQVARAAGVRATGTPFGAYLCPMGNELPGIRGTEFEIV